MRLSRYKKSTVAKTVIDLNDLGTYLAPYNHRVKLAIDGRSFKDDEGYWHVYPIGFSDCQVYIICPHCGEIHMHGKHGKTIGDYEGWRVAHCITRIALDGYVIERLKLA